MHNFSQYHSIYQVLPTQLDQVNETMCAQFNRKGYLCSECKENYGLAAYGLMCVKCSSSAWKWLLYFFLVFTPPTILFLTFLILNIKVHSGGLSAFIFLAQTLTRFVFLWPCIVSITQNFFGFWPVHILLSLYGVWSLNFIQFMLPMFCVSEHLGTLQLISLGYVSSVYPLVLCIVTYYLIQLHAGGNWLLVKLWRPFHRCVSNSNRQTSIESSVIHNFGTFVLLSYGNNLSVSKILLWGYALVELDVRTTALTFLPSRSVDLGATYFGYTHAPYAALGILGGILTVILPLALVMIFPTRLFPKLISCCGLRRWHAIRMFMEVFISSYEDGTGTKRDYRFFATIYLLGQALIGTGMPSLKISGLVQYYWLTSAAPFIVLAVIFAFIKPHRKQSHNIADILILLLMAKVNIFLHIAFETSVSNYALRVIFVIILIDLAIPQIVLISYFCFKLISWIRSLKGTCKTEKPSQLAEGEIQHLLCPNNTP